MTAILVASMLAMITAGASAAERHVGPGQTNTTIQAAVTAASSGDTIIVHDSTYHENVDVNKRLTIQSQNGSANCTVNALDSNGDVFDVGADYVNISGFTVEGATGTYKAGFHLNGRQHCNISDNNASNNYRGIRMYSSSNNTLTNNTANSNNDFGIYLKSSSNNTLTNNTASNNYRGIYLYYSSNNNTLTNNTANSNTQCGIYLYDSSNNNTLTNNTASNNYRGIRLYSSSNNNTLTNNTANSNNGDGICLGYSSSNTLTNNTANSNNDKGIHLYHSSSNTLTSNTASNNDKGIHLYHSSEYNTLTSNTANSNTQYGIYLSYSSSNNNVSCNWVQNNTNAGFYLTLGSTGNTIGQNNIIANGASQANRSYQWQFNNSQDNAVSTADNWWGTNNESIITASITGTGTVTTSPKLDGPAPCAPIPEAATIILLAVGLLMLVGYVRIGRNK